MVGWRGDRAICRKDLVVGRKTERTLYLMGGSEDALLPSDQIGELLLDIKELQGLVRLCYSGFKLFVIRYLSRDSKLEIVGETEILS